MYVQNDTLLLADVFGNFRKMCLERHKLDPAKLRSPPGLAWQADLKSTKVNLDFLTHIEMVEKELKEEYVTLLINMQKLVTNT